ncbi:energy-coupling factor ABC transporter ATP-binding protein [Bacillus kexueae]|uniref:energy-coupling factor ABC transporter ATP-binding protein n=1 Tax=Aeribacillus kexueae TaxID=2078952 RepID=UPI001FAF7F8E|nr:energy-coupling factor ABC transporter ATP-binding protein [Bacillus kexueae]
MQISINQLEHRYQVRTPFERLALYDVSLQIEEGSYVAIIGHTGSGKSTLLQHLNALLVPTKGSIQLGDYRVEAGKKLKNVKPIRKKVGIVFQFPEHQLFEETVEKDIMFGPINFGLTEEEARKKAHEALAHVGLHPDLLTRSPFDLSGGQMRRVAIAGVLAMEPEVLVLDEPTAGLDPKGRTEMMDMFYRLHQEKGLTTILVTHSMEDAARYADTIAVMHEGTLAVTGTPKELFQSPELLSTYGLDLPETVKFMMKVEEQLGIKVKDKPLTIDETVTLIKQMIRGQDQHVK